MGSELFIVDIISYRDGFIIVISWLCIVDYIEMIDGSVVFDVSVFIGSWEGRKKERKDEERGRGIYVICLKIIIFFVVIFMKGFLNNFWEENYK